MRIRTLESAVRRVSLRPLLLLQDRRAQDMIEYALLAAFVAVLVGVILPEQTVAPIKAIFTTVSGQLDAAGGS